MDLFTEKDLCSINATVVCLHPVVINSYNIPYIILGNTTHSSVQNLTDPFFSIPLVPKPKTFCLDIDG